MSFRRARFSSFRNLEDAELDVDAERIFLVGENGQGKTNFLEALYYLSFGSSFRGQSDALVTARGADGFGLWASVGLANDSGLDNEVSVRVEGSSKDIRLNGKSLKDRKELVARNPSVVFCHEDYTFAAGDPERRRFFFDQCAGMLSLSYIDSLRSYKRVLKQRNAALKESARDLLDVLDPQLVRYGLELVRGRAELFASFSAVFPGLYEYVSRLGSKVELSYAPAWKADAGEDELVEMLAARRNDDIVMGMTRSGPHRDRWSFSCGGASFTDSASTGQLRLVSLVLRVIEARTYAGLGPGVGHGTGAAGGAAGVAAGGTTDQAAGSRAVGSASGGAASGARSWPVLLLDDVLLELDVSRRRRFLELLPGRGEGAQAFFTFLPEEPWREYAGAGTIVYGVSGGRFQGKERI